MEAGPATPAPRGPAGQPPVMLPEDQMRFVAELEFVQCLASPSYIHFLAQRKYFDDPKFMQYLRYLRYWKEPEYAVHIRFPQCLAFLDILSSSSDAARKFRADMAKAEFQQFVHDQQFFHWQFSALNRRRETDPFSQRVMEALAQASADTDPQPRNGAAASEAGSQNGTDPMEQGT
uniref:Mediator of RNA polymerase II transcription subunit 31 n=1 Tax=Rhizochromulina marina TaxID=1034831 RepID=A0A7S2RAC1_9STRA